MATHSSVLAWRIPGPGEPGGVAQSRTWLKWLSSSSSSSNAGDADLIPGLGRSPGEGNDNPVQYSCLGNPMDRGAWQGFSAWGHKRIRYDWALMHDEWEDYSDNLGEEAEISRNQATAHFLTFMVTLGNYQGTWGCVLACWCVTLSVYWGSRSSGSRLISHLDLFGSNQLMPFPWAMSFFKGCALPPCVSKPLGEKKRMFMAS